MTGDCCEKIMSEHDDKDIMGDAPIMTCDCCDRKATVFLTQIVGDKMQKVNLCDACSKEQGVTDPTGFALADLLTGIGNEKPIRRPARPREAACPACGFTQTDFKKTGRLGCANCYTVFREAISSILANMHRGTHHTGKRPCSAGIPPEEDFTSPPPRPNPASPTGQPSPFAIQKVRLDTLQSELAAAVAAENYEKAADLRDKIQKLQSP
ncbi:UvrB/UvrC motif-containing protein [soil metagenome]